MNTQYVAESATRGCSVYEQAEKAAEEHKWLESEKAGRDLGDEAVRHWHRDHWLRFYRWRFVQHLRGEVYYREFHPATFAVVGIQIKESGDLLQEIVNQVRHGAENLDIICWAQSRDLPVDPVLEILEAIDINRQRLQPLAENE